MAEVVVKKYDLFDNAVSTGNSLKNSLSNSNTNINSYQSSLLESMVFVGPIADNCKEAMNYVSKAIQINIEEIGQMNTILTAVKNSYESADNTSLEAVTNTTGEVSLTSDSSNLTVTSTGYVVPFSNDVEYKVTSVYGKRKAPTAGATSYHRGIDIAANKGTPIHAISGGEVISAGTRGGYGYCVRVRQDDGKIVYYAHCSKLTVKEGDRIKAGDVVGNVGSTGVSTGPHLHLEIRTKDGNNRKERAWVDPLSDAFFGNSLPGKKRKT